MWIFIKFSGHFGCDRRHYLEHFGEVAFKLLYPGFIFLFSGFVIFSNIMEKWMNIFSGYVSRNPEK